MPDQLDCVVIGAGVIGLAAARALALAGREVVVLEAEPEIGMHTSSRNSEVIHAGIYYDAGSLKARLCVIGKEMLYRFCDERHVPYQRIGKLIVVPDKSERPQLEAIRARAVANGVTDLEFIDAARIRALEPAVQGEAGLLSPSTGIIDSHSLMVTLQADVEAHGGNVLTHSRVAGIEKKSGGFRLRVEGIDEQFDCNTLINAAGLWASDIARLVDGTSGICADDKTFFAKGHYFAYQGKSPFRHLVYPVPVDGGLGVHATNDMGGAARFGPDVEWIDAIDYGFDDSRKDRFVASIRKFFPDLDENKLAPAYTGIRPKRSGPNTEAMDFGIHGPAAHGIDGLVNLVGIESPGLTAALAIGDYVEQLLRG